MISRFMLLLGLLVVGIPQGLADPLGIRTNNPGNIIKTTITWKGEVECESRFECFSSPEYGIRALALNLLNYQRRYNLRTVEDIIHRWSPPSENRTDQLVRVVSQRLGIQRDRKLDLENPLILRGLMSAIIIQENGYNPYDSILIQEITNGLTNSNGNPNDGRRSLARRGDEAVGDETTDLVGTTEDDSSDTRSSTERARTDQAEYQPTLSVDSKGNCTDMRICSYPLTQVSSGDCSGSPSHYWVDRVESRIPFLLGLRVNGLAYSERPDPNPPRHPRGQLDPWAILRLFDGRSQPVIGGLSDEL